MHTPIWLQTLKTCLLAPDIPRNSPMITWKAFMARFFVKRMMLTITMQACQVAQLQDWIKTERELNKFCSLLLTCSHLPLPLLWAVFYDNMMALRRKQKSGRVLKYSFSSPDSKKSSSRLSASSDVVGTWRVSFWQALWVSFMMTQLTWLTMMCLR